MWFCLVGFVSIADAKTVRVVELNEVERELTQSLKMSVQETGPYRPWVVRWSNTGPRPVEVVADPRLLWFEAIVPGKRQKKLSCRIPKRMRPETVEASHRAHRVFLSPGATHELQIDPRFYCFAEGDQSVLVPGTHLTPYWGWPEKVKTTWQQGQRVELRGAQQPPFVAKLASAAASKPKAGKRHRRPVKKSSQPDIGSPDAALTPFERSQGLKQLKGEGLSLNSAYIAWSVTRLIKEEPTTEPVLFEVVRGSDSRSARGARVTVQLTNRSPSTKYVFARRELLSFMLLGPDGVTMCTPAGRLRAPDRQAFTRLRPGESLRLTSRILEFCDKRHLERPGFYQIAAEIDLREDGKAAGVDAFTGRLRSRLTRPIRISTGERPFRFPKLPTLKQARRSLDATMARKKAALRGGPPANRRHHAGRKHGAGRKLGAGREGRDRTVSAGAPQRRPGKAPSSDSPSSDSPSSDSPSGDAPNSPRTSPPAGAAPAPPRPPVLPPGVAPAK